MEPVAQKREKYIELSHAHQLEAMLLGAQGAHGPSTLKLIYAIAIRKHS